MLLFRDPSQQRRHLLTTPTSQKQVFMACHSGEKKAGSQAQAIKCFHPEVKACLLLTFHWPELVRSSHLTFNSPCASQQR